MIEDFHSLGFYRLIFTLRSTSEGGKFSGSPESRQNFFREASLLGVPLIDLEAETDENVVFPTPTQKVVLSSHSDDFPSLKMAMCKTKPRFNVFCGKIVTVSSNAELITEFTCQEFKALPTISIFKDDPSSRLKNRYLTPCCLPGMSAFPGQLSLHDILQGRQLLNLSAKTKKYFLVGDPVFKSRGPLWHNFWFGRATVRGKSLRLIDGHYSAVPCGAAEEVRKLMKDART